MANRKKLVITGGLIVIIACVAYIAYQQYAPVTDLFRKEKAAAMQVVKSFSFSAENSLKEWEEKVLKNKVVYKIEKQEGEDAHVRAQSDNAASALYYKIKLPVNRNPVISWKWRVDEFPQKKLPESISGKKEEDFAARVYVMFPAAFFTHSKVVEYVWAEDLPAGTTGPSGYSKNIQVMVLKSGKIEDGWAYEERDIVKDYEALFGERPRLDVGAIAFMTDADSTRTTADSVYDEIQIGYKGGDKK